MRILTLNLNQRHQVWPDRHMVIIRGIRANKNWLSFSQAKVDPSGTEHSARN
jgi:hypothetical protein